MSVDNVIYFQVGRERRGKVSWFQTNKQTNTQTTGKT